MVHDMLVDLLEVTPARVEAAAYNLIRYIMAAFTHTVSNTSHCYLWTMQSKK